MTHVAPHSVPEAGREDGYDLAHRRIPDDLPATFAQLARDPICRSSGAWPTSSRLRLERRIHETSYL